MLNQYCHYIDVELRDWLFEQLKTIIVNFFQKLLVDFYKGVEGAVNFRDMMPESSNTYLDRLKVS